MKFDIERGDFGGKCESSFKMGMDKSRDDGHIMIS